MNNSKEDLFRIDAYNKKNTEAPHIVLTGLTGEEMIVLVKELRKKGYNVRPTDRVKRKAINHKKDAINTEIFGSRKSTV